MFEGFIKWRNARRAKADQEAIANAIQEIPDVRAVTPECTVQYAHLFKPDTKFDENGVYRVDATADKTKEWDEILGKIDKLQNTCEEAVKTAGGNPRPSEFPPIDEEDGVLSLRAKRKAKTLKGKTIPAPLVVDENGRHMSETPWGGSRVKLALILRAYYSPTIGAGVTAYLQAVQVTHLVAGGESWDPFGAQDEPAPEEGDSEEVPF